VTVNITKPISVTYELLTNSVTGDASILSDSEMIFWGKGTVTCRLIGLDNFFDDGDTDSLAVFQPQIYYGYTYKYAKATYYAETSTSFSSTTEYINTTYSGDLYARKVHVSVTNVDDDTAGIEVIQANTSIKSYKTATRDSSDVQTATLYAIYLPENKTTEWGGNISFSVRLTSEPHYTVTCEVTTEAVAPNGGDDRYEGARDIYSFLVIDVGF
jgi:hypothetical protein